MILANSLEYTLLARSAKQGRPLLARPAGLYGFLAKIATRFPVS